MTMNDKLGMTLCAAAAIALFAPTAAAKVDSNKKGSLVFYSKVEIRWDNAGGLLQDTFLQLTNDYPEDVRVQFYHINGDAPLDEPGVRFHPGWNYVDNGITLTGDQTTYWSALTGQPAVGGMAPFTSLDPGFPPGRPDPDTGGRMLRGYVIGWAVNAANEQIAWDHLNGHATIVDYQRGAAWKYNTFNFDTNDNARGSVVGDPGELELDGTKYDEAYSHLLLNFQAVGSNAYSGPRQVLANTDLTLYPLDNIDLRQEGCGPETTKAHFDIWNMNEVKFSGVHRCITCWDQTLLSNYGQPNHFLIQVLQTNHGKARIEGLASQVCDVDVDPNDGIFPPADRCNPDPATESHHPDDVVSTDSALLGVFFELLIFDAGVDNGWAGATLGGMGVNEYGDVRYDVLAPPPEGTLPPDADRENELIEWLENEVDRRIKGPATGSTR
ncbi:MAG: hypothetical protein ACYTGP_11810 [Planctomycetota bacterium]|jgi:hypothetical protein